VLFFRPLAKEPSSELNVTTFLRVRHRSLKKQSQEREGNVVQGTKGSKKLGLKGKKQSFQRQNFNC